MQYRLMRNLGLTDARKCNIDFGAKLDLTMEALAEGQTIDLPNAAAEYLKDARKGLLEECASVRGIAKKPELVAPEK